MNFIVIVSDTLRNDYLGYNNNDWISTPNIDQFAEISQVFDRAYCASFPTVPNRRDLLTGRFTASYAGWSPLSSRETVLADVLGKAGYTSMMICDTPHIVRKNYYYNRGFDGFEWIRGQENDRWKTFPVRPEDPCDPKKLRSPDNVRIHRRNISDWKYESDRFVARTMSKACEWLEENHRIDQFLLYVDTFDPHEPWDAPQWYVDMYDPDYTGEVVDYPRYGSTDILSHEELVHCRALYAAEVTLVDRWVGRLFEKIRDLGLLENTVILFTSDHGILLGEHGIIGKAVIEQKGDIYEMAYIPLYEEINHIPLLIYHPNVKPRRRNALVQPFDLMPTILELAGIPKPDSVHGESFCHLFRSNSDKHRDFAVSAPYLRSGAGITILKGQWAGVLFPAAKESIAQDHQVDYAVDGIPKEIAAKGKKVDLLFDLESDPNQNKSVASAHLTIIEDMRKSFVDNLLKKIGTDGEIIDMWQNPSVE